MLLYKPSKLAGTWDYFFKLRCGMATEVDRLKTAFWCRFLFKKWGVQSPQELTNYRSKRAVLNKQVLKVDEIVGIYEGSKIENEARGLLLNTDLRKWRDYFFGKRSPTMDFVYQVEKLVPGSAFFYTDGAQGMFNVMSAETPDLAIEIFKDNLLIALEKSEGTDFYKDELIGFNLSENEPPSPKYQRISITDEEIESIEADNWLDEFRAMGSYLPNIDSFFLGFPIAEIENLYINIAYEIFRARFLTDNDRYHNLAKIFFAKSQIEALYNFELNMGIPSQLWLEVPCIKSASDWYNEFIATAN